MLLSSILSCKPLPTHLGHGLTITLPSATRFLIIVMLSVQGSHLPRLYSLEISRLLDTTCQIERLHKLIVILGCFTHENTSTAEHPTVLNVFEDTCTHSLSNIHTRKQCNFT